MADPLLQAHYGDITNYSTGCVLDGVRFNCDFIQNLVNSGGGIEAPLDNTRSMWNPVTRQNELKRFFVDWDNGFYGFVPISATYGGDGTWSWNKPRPTLRPKGSLSSIGPDEPDQQEAGQKFKLPNLPLVIPKRYLRDPNNEIRTDGLNEISNNLGCLQIFEALAKKLGQPFGFMETLLRTQFVVLPLDPEGASRSLRDWGVKPGQESGITANELDRSVENVLGNSYAMTLWSIGKVFISVRLFQNAGDAFRGQAMVHETVHQMLYSGHRDIAITLGLKTRNGKSFKGLPDNIKVDGLASEALNNFLIDNCGVPRQ